MTLHERRHNVPAVDQPSRPLTDFERDAFDRLTARARCWCNRPANGVCGCCCAEHDDPPPNTAPAPATEDDGADLALLVVLIAFIAIAVIGIVATCWVRANYEVQPTPDGPAVVRTVQEDQR